MEAVLTRLGFAAHWISIIMKCVTTVRYSFIVNGKPRGYITPSRGLRQGDPLSPFLFLLCTEGFSSLLTQKATLGLLQGVSICSSAPPVLHLLFTDDSLLFARASLADYDHIKQVLYTYELASGQKVNFTKSSIVFSKNVCSSPQSSIASALHMSVVPVHEKYLGLPTYVGRGRVDTFSYIKERLTKKLEGWQGKMLSGAGKDILVRVCAQVLPTYAMNCFLLPKKSCDELQQLCAKWWGSSLDKNKIHWLNWDALCKPKEEGGLSFRNLHLFNLAMLAKQAWRIVQNPSSLISQLYKSRYFPDGDFWSAPQSVNPSYSWSSILSSRDILHEGSCWQVGSGHLIRIWEDNWLPHLPTLHPSERPANIFTPEYVNDLLLPDQSWNVPLVQSIFDPIDAEAILLIPLSRYSSADRLVWHHHPKGVLTVNSTYKVAFNKRFPPSSSMSDPFRGLWKGIWSTSIPSKVKIHIWRTVVGILPTVSKLRSRFCFVEQGCQCCSSPVESIVHISRDCPFTIALLSSCPNLVQVTSSSCRLAFPSFETWLLHCFEELNTISFSSLLFLLWSVWKERNARIWHDKSITIATLSCQAWSYLQAFRAVHYKPKPSKLRRLRTQWSAPPVGWIKANLDGAYDQSSNTGDIGIVFRDSSGSVLGGMSKFIRYVTSAEHAEANAGREACFLAAKYALTPVLFEFDSAILVSASRSIVPHMSTLGRVYDDILSSLMELSGSSFVHVYREGNSLAHNLARYALNFLCDVTWYGEIPFQIKGLFFHM